MHRLRFVSLVACLAVFQLLCVSGTVHSANPSAKKKAGRIMGVVLDVNDARVVGATIKVDGPGFKWQGQTDDAGEFALEAPAGEYRIYVYASGFRRFESPFLKIKPGVKEMVNLHLEVAAMNGLILIESKKSLRHSTSWNRPWKTIV